MEAEALINLIRVGWGQENPAFRQQIPIAQLDGEAERDGLLGVCQRQSA
jgi:hypothetical protein